MKILFMKEFELPAEETEFVIDLVGDGAGEIVPSEVYFQVSMVEGSVEMNVQGGAADDGKAFPVCIFNSSTLGKVNKIEEEGLFVFDASGLSYLTVENTGKCLLRVKALV